jgi:hypothetical protein
VNPVVASQLAGLEQKLGEQVAEVLAAARACPPGGNFNWDRILESYGATPQSADDRLRTVAEAKLGAGASPVEVKRVLDVIVGRAQADLEALAAQTGPQDFRIGGLRYRLAALSDKEQQEYSTSVAVRASVSSVFANAKASAALQPWKQVEYKAGFTYACVHCGAPQQAQLDFKCLYCGQHITDKAPAR